MPYDEWIGHLDGLIGNDKSEGTSVLDTSLKDDESIFELSSG